ncbi:DNA polymerase III subunit delta [Methylogaea oryzae]|uniref:DNA polymerase III subunit delta n=1 Tax=Methylogaea oryzae TaxID=1295382 RepID=A0A8D4VS40_9GAMM|nr:DNA polymerase III subunit delta [Methylogaea oryzae]BBL72727.1 DNA polymerase III subunit delta [Methylogaea oryzae]
MRLKPEQLDGALRKGLLPAYVISGDEPLQVQEAADAVRAAARQAGYTGREVFFADSGFDWNRLLEATDSSPLFGDRNVLDLRLNGAPDKQGAAALARYAARAGADNLLLISLPRLKPAEQKAAWFADLDKIGAVVQVWPLEGPQLLDWLERRLQKRGLAADRAGVQLLASLVEGNLLAAAQEVEKLHALHGSSRLSSDDILEAVADRARYDIFGFTDAVLAGQPARIVRMLAGLQAEGEAAPVILWALARDIRLLLALHGAGPEGFEAQLRRHKSPDKRKPLLQRALRRLPADHLHDLLRLAARTDRAIKGMEPDDPWDGLLHLALGLAGNAVVPTGL